MKIKKIDNKHAIIERFENVQQRFLFKIISQFSQKTFVKIYCLMNRNFFDQSNNRD